MASNSIEVHASTETLFAVLVDPQTYPHWLVGAADIRSVDDAWPAPGSKFHHRVGFGPLKLADSTKVLDLEPDRLLRLAVRARPLISAVATFRLVGDGRRCVVSLEEEPAHHLVGALVRPVLDPLTHLRNHASLRRLRDFVELRHGLGLTAGARRVGSHPG